MSCFQTLRAVSFCATCRLTPGFCSSSHACFQLLQLQYDELLSKFTCEFNLGHYSEGTMKNTNAVKDALAKVVGAVTRQLLSST